MTAEDRSGCSEISSRVAPVVDRNRCEGKRECVRVCPYGVFTVQALADSDRPNLSLLGRLKAWAHGGKQAYVTNPLACHACQLCISACPEKALTLSPIEG